MKRCRRVDELRLIKLQMEIGEEMSLRSRDVGIEGASIQTLSALRIDGAERHAQDDHTNTSGWHRRGTPGPPVQSR